MYPVRRRAPRRLWLALRDDFHPGESETSTCSSSSAPIDGYAKAVAHFDLLDGAASSCSARRVDLVMTGAVKNRYIARDIERTRQLLYAA